MSFKPDNAAFETWLRTRCRVVEKDLEYKHQRMGKNSFVFYVPHFSAGQSESKHCVLKLRMPHRFSLSVTRTLKISEPGAMPKEDKGSLDDLKHLWPFKGPAAVE
jgi:hypothetical protein